MFKRIVRVYKEIRKSVAPVSHLRMEWQHEKCMWPTWPELRAYQEWEASSHECVYSCRSRAIDCLSYHSFTFSLVTLYIAVFMCAWFGHAWTAISVDAENGMEELYCERCGYSHHVQW